MRLNLSQCHLCSSSKLRTKHVLKHYEILECMDCGLLAQSPLPSYKELYAIYNDTEYWERPYFREFRVGYDRSSNTVRMYEWALARLERLCHGKGQLLDVGCATGVFLHIAANRGWDTSGIDGSVFAAEYAKRDFGLDVKQGMVEDVSLPASRYHVISLWDVIEHLRTPKQTVSKLSQALRPNGIMLIYTPNASSLVRQMAPILDFVIPPKPKTFVEMVYSPLHIYYFNPKTMKTLLERNSIEVLEVYQLPMSPERAGHGTPSRRIILRFLDAIGRMLDRGYRFLVFGQKQ